VAVVLDLWVACELLPVDAEVEVDVVAMLDDWVSPASARGALAMRAAMVRVKTAFMGDSPLSVKSFRDRVTLFWFLKDRLTFTDACPILQPGRLRGIQ